jgi:hypothetical protein
MVAEEASDVWQHERDYEYQECQHSRRPLLRLVAGVQPLLTRPLPDRLFLTKKVAFAFAINAADNPGR